MKNICIEGKFILQSTFNPGLAFTGLRTTWPWGHFLKGPETFHIHKATFSLSVSENGELSTPETSHMKRVSVRIKNIYVNKIAL